MNIYGFHPLYHLEELAYTGQLLWLSVQIETTVLESLWQDKSMTSICLCHKHLPSWGTETRANELFQYCKQAAVIFHVCVSRSGFEENCA